MQLIHKGEEYEYVITKWVAPPDRFILACQVAAWVYFIAKGGRRIISMVAACGVITRSEYLCGKEDVEKLKREREKKCFFLLKDKITELSVGQKRRGFKGYRGYFKIVGVEPYHAKSI